MKAAEALMIYVPFAQLAAAETVVENFKAELLQSFIILFILMITIPFILCIIEKDCIYYLFLGKGL